MLPHQLAHAPIFDISIDNSFWWFHYSGLASAMSDHPGLVLSLEVLFVILMAGLWFRPHPVGALILLAVVVILSMYQQTWSATLTKISVVLPVLILPFCFPAGRFNTTWKLPRYYLAYLMVSAALFKLFNGGLFHPHQMEAILSAQHADLALTCPESRRLSLSHFLSTPGIAAASYVGIFLLEASFAGLLFTRRWDRWYAVAVAIFCIGIWAVMRIQTAEILLLALPLLCESRNNP